MSKRHISYIKEKRLQVLPNKIFERHNLLVQCPNCNATNPVPIRGWHTKACHNCGNQILHPSAKVTGSKAHGKKSNSITARLPENLVAWLDKEAKVHDTSRGGYLNFIVEFFKTCQKK